MNKRHCWNDIERGNGSREKGLYKYTSVPHRRLESRPGLRDEKQTTYRLSRNMAAETEINLIMAYIQYNLTIHFLPKRENKFLLH
jgi:hypothetical protein